MDVAYVIWTQNSCSMLCKLVFSATNPHHSSWLKNVNTSPNKKGIHTDETGNTWQPTEQDDEIQQLAAN